MIRYRFLKGGAFVAGDTKTGRTSYAYPTSPSADRAKAAPTKIALRMMASENKGGEWRESQLCRDYDTANWKLLNEEN